MGFKDAFNFILRRHQRSGTLSRVGTSPQSVPISYSPTSQYRNLEGPDNTVFEGRQFIITKTNLDNSGFIGKLKRGDRIVDSELGTLTMREIQEMYEFGANVVGYRVTTD